MPYPIPQSNNVAEVVFLQRSEPRLDAVRCMAAPILVPAVRGRQSFVHENPPVASLMATMCFDPATARIPGNIFRHHLGRVELQLPIALRARFGLGQFQQCLARPSALMIRMHGNVVRQQSVCLTAFPPRRGRSLRLHGGICEAINPSYPANVIRASEAVYGLWNDVLPDTRSLFGSRGKAIDAVGQGAGSSWGRADIAAHMRYAFGNPTKGSARRLLLDARPPSQHTHR
jgi:hypothetical protein